MEKGKVYIGFRDSMGVAHVNIAESRDGRTSQHALKHVVRHSPTGLEWGYMGSGPADLANSILSDTIGHMANGVAPAMYQAFKHDVIAKLPQDGFRLRQEDVFAWLNSRWSEMDQDRIREDLAVA